ncbi:MAG: hypothetical protein HOG03_25180 [Desulfobacula sp.]|uniref:hypothetical protein n=1 Tax=Desulfobacula sp. TaxID=2593537 RepID=UPI001EC40347|nr:hypothetical protein [Desulfobacula sp.]
MDNFLDKIFFRSRNFDYISQNLIDLTIQTPANRIFEALNTYSEGSEVRYVGGCVRKIIKKQIVDDIDLAVNLNPNEVCDLLKKNNISLNEKYSFLVQIFYALDIMKKNGYTHNDLHTHNIMYEKSNDYIKIRNKKFKSKPSSILDKSSTFFPSKVLSKLLFELFLFVF